MKQLVPYSDNHKIIDVECRKGLILTIVLDIDRILRLALLELEAQHELVKPIITSAAVSVFLMRYLQLANEASLFFVVVDNGVCHIDIAIKRAVLEKGYEINLVQSKNFLRSYTWHDPDRCKLGDSCKCFCIIDAALLK